MISEWSNKKRIMGYEGTLYGIALQNLLFTPVSEKNPNLAEIAEKVNDNPKLVISSPHFGNTSVYAFIGFPVEGAEELYHPTSVLVYDTPLEDLVKRKEELIKELNSVGVKDGINGYSSLEEHIRLYTVRR